MVNHSKLVSCVVIGLAAILLIVLIFVKMNLDTQGAFLCEVVHESPDYGMEQCPAHKGSTSWLLLIAFGVGLFVLGVGVYLFFTPALLQKPGKKVFKKIDLSGLGEEEKSIYEIVKQYDGSMYQSVLIKETGFSKVKVTRILDKLEGKGIIERKRRGMTNIIILKSQNPT